MPDRADRADRADLVVTAGLTVASAGGHGMLWGPGVARVATDLAVHGATRLIDATELTHVGDLGLDRFDAEGRSRLATDPIALPFPVSVDEDDDVPSAATGSTAAR